MKKLLLAAVAGVLATGAAAAPASAHPGDRPQVEVMTQNLYIGADLSRLLAGEAPASILATVQQTDFPARAQQIARAIDDFNPDLVALQEVTTIEVSTPGAGGFQTNYLHVLLRALEARGERYAVASAVTNAQVTLPPDAAGASLVTVTDRDVILYRTGSTSVANPVSGTYGTTFVAPVGGALIPFPRGWTAVDATVDGRTYRVVDTHLEVAGAPCPSAAGPVSCQEAQAAELAGLVAGDGMPTILAGDLNAEPGSAAYGTIEDAGLLDTWTVRYPYNDESGSTCCQAEDLLNPESLLDQRIDHIFIDDDLDTRRIVATVVGDWQERRTRRGLWYSDHGGPFARITLE